LSLGTLVRAKYFDGDDERFSDRSPADRPLNEIFGKPGK
jgi:hypothetical protein